MPKSEIAAAALLAQMSNPRHMDFILGNDPQRCRVGKGAYAPCPAATETKGGGHVSAFARRRASADKSLCPPNVWQSRNLTPRNALGDRAR